MFRNFSMEERATNMQIDKQKLFDIVKEGGALFRNREEAAHITVKGVSDYVTQVDFHVQEQIRTGLMREWTQIQFMGEEKDNSDIDFTKAVWILDPVDGTTNLIHDFRHPYVKHTTKKYNSEKQKTQTIREST